MLVARDGDEVAEHVRALDAGARPRDRRRPRTARVLARAHLRPPRGAGGGAARRAAAPAPRGERVSDAAAHRHPRACRSPRRGATGTPPPTAAWCASSCARGHDVLFLERDVPWYASNRDLPRSAVRAHARSTTAWTSSSDGSPPTVRDADLVIVGSYVPEAIAVGDWVLRHGARRRPPSTTSTRR